MNFGIPCFHQIKGRLSKIHLEKKMKKNHFF